MEKLSLLTDLEEEEIYTIFSVISNLVESDKDKLLESMNRIQVAKRVLEIIKNVIKSATENNAEVQFSSKNFMIETKELTPSEDENPIVGAAVSRTTNDEISVEFLSANTTPSKSECIAYFVLPIDFVKDRERQKIFGDKITFGYFRDWLLFSNPNPEKSLDMRNYEVLSTPVVFASMSEGPAGNLGHPVQLYFKDMVRATTDMPVCVYYDPYLEDINGGWSAEGCEFAGLTDGFYSCRCHHLSVFSIYLAHYPVVTSNTKPTFSIIVYVGGAISFLILSFAVVLFTISKMFRETHDHFVLLNVALSFLISVGLITFSDLLHSLCRVLSLLLLYTIFVTMQWLISYAILFKMKFTKKRCVSEMPSWKNLIKWSIIPLVLPIFIVYLIWPTKYYDPFKGSCLSLLTAVSQTSMIALSFDMFFSLCMYASAAHSWYKKAKVFMDAETEELARKFRIIFAVNVLYCYREVFTVGLLSKEQEKNIAKRNRKIHQEFRMRR
ncbi:adhesion G-protein coupled receptor G6-like isoform X2 [Uloborus diversus]|uniref:adhesion G-protein coupled receptor G6-like isoform X2 n=1 Tax=Uloborus diversus TaxID=327109 RepID=UPI002409B1D5|nr:adhesion G-protein coupled receptor G6-like isoform X2 [Uloborus diversus]